MKKLLLSLLILSCFVTFADGQGIITISKKKGSAGGTLGDTTEDYAQGNDLAANEIDCMLYVASATGTANQAYLNHVGTDTDNCKVGVCNYDSDPPDAGDDGCLWTSGNTINTAGKIALTGNIGKAVTQGTTYFVCAMGGTGGCHVEYNSTGTGIRTLYYESSTGGWAYATPPANLLSAATPWSTAANRDWGVYVVID